MKRSAPRYGRRVARQLAFETNRDQVADPSVLDVGTPLRIPSLRFGSPQ
jgi:hypothetical protein